MTVPQAPNGDEFLGVIVRDAPPKMVVDDETEHLGSRRDHGRAEFRLERRVYCLHALRLAAKMGNREKAVRPRHWQGGKSHRCADLAGRQIQLAPRNPVCVNATYSAPIPSEQLERQRNLTRDVSSPSGCS